MTNECDLFNYQNRISRSYHNTNREQGKTLIASNKQAGYQEYVILEIFHRAFQRYGTGKIIMPRLFEFTPCDIWTEFKKSGYTWPLTSIRRAISNLTRKGFLIKTENLREGIFGKQVHTWRFAG